MTSNPPLDRSGSSPRTGEQRLASTVEIQWSSARLALDRLTLDVGSERLEFFFDSLVAPIDLADIVDGTLALGCQRRGPTTTTRGGSQKTMRAPIEISESTKNIRPSNIFSKNRTVPSACVATVIAIDIMSLGKAGHGASSMVGMLP